MTTSAFVQLSDNELVAVETIKHCRRIGNYTEVLLWGEVAFRQLWDADKILWNQIKTQIKPSGKTDKNNK